MDAQSRQQALNNISPADLEKIKAHHAKTTGAYPVDNEWLLLAEFAKAFGWQAYLDARSNRLDLAEMMTLLEAHRKLEYFDLYRNAEAAFVGSGSAQSTKPSQTFKLLTDGILKKAKADV